MSQQNRVAGRDDQGRGRLLEGAVRFVALVFLLLSSVSGSGLSGTTGVFLRAAASELSAGSIQLQRSGFQLRHNTFDVDRLVVIGKQPSTKRKGWKPSDDAAVAHAAKLDPVWQPGTVAPARTQTRHAQATLLGYWTRAPPALG